MDEEKTSAQWARLIQEEQEAFQKASRQHNQAEPGRGIYHAALLNRDWYKANSALLLEYCRLARSGRQYFEDGEVIVPPINAIGRIANIAETISTGNEHPSLKYALGLGGNPERWPAARRCQAYAVFYVELCRQNAIEDKKFIKSVVDAYDVDRGTVDRWAGEERDYICDGLSAPEPQNARLRMLIEGHNYQFNRSEVSPADWCIGLAIHFMTNSATSETARLSSLSKVMRLFGMERSDIEAWEADAESYLQRVPAPHPDALFSCLTLAGEAYRNGRMR